MIQTTDCEVVVAGGGMAGCAAAISSARSGRKTLLIERYGFLGGWATAGLVNPFMSHCASDGKPLVAGLYDEIRDRLRGMNALVANSFDSEAMKFVLQEMVLESGAQINLHTCCASARYADGGTVVLGTGGKCGGEETSCERLIDCTGDGDVAVELGAKYEMGDESGLPQAVTLMFDVGGVDVVEALRYVKARPDQMRFPKLDGNADPEELAKDVVSVAGYYDLIQGARDAGEYEAPGDLIFYISRPTRGEVVFNTTHVGEVDGTNHHDLTRAEVESRRQMMSILAFVRKYVPGFKEAYLVRSAVHVGVRETRRLLGHYVFSADDVVEGRKFDDAICRLAYSVDVHSGKGTGYTKSEESGRPGIPPPGDWYEIPYRCLIPLGIDNVLAAGRCVSSTQEGHGAIRIMPCCIAMGQAAGTAAALSIAHDVGVDELDTSELRDALREQGALL